MLLGVPRKQPRTSLAPHVHAGLDVLPSIKCSYVQELVEIDFNFKDDIVLLLRVEERACARLVWASYPIDRIWSFRSANTLIPVVGSLYRSSTIARTWKGLLQTEGAGCFPKPIRRHHLP